MLILHEILLSHLFLMHEISKRKVTNGFGVKQIKSIITDKGIVEQGLGQLLPQVNLIFAIKPISSSISLNLTLFAEDVEDAK